MMCTDYRNGENKGYRMIVRGAGDIATGTIHRLFMAGFRPVVLESAAPSAIRRQVAMCEAVYDGCVTVEGVTARLAESLSDAVRISEGGEVPVIVDESGASISEYMPDVLVDAILAKKNLGTTREAAPLTIALGPGFEAGKDCDYVIETMRGHNLARIISSGSALPNTGTPGVIGGFSSKRVIYAASEGVFESAAQIGDAVGEGDVIAYIRQRGGGAAAVHASIPGIIRGLIRDGYELPSGMKIADIDPRLEERVNCFTISDKARAIGGSVLELVCADLAARTGMLR